jgi:O-antigen biosynthesis protein
MPRVSLVTPCHDGQRFLSATIDSALAQTHADVEVIVVDDASTDATPEIVARYGNRVLGQRLASRRGACHARNVGLAMATGQVVLFLDADDVLAPDTLVALERTLASAAGPALAACPWRRLIERRGSWSVAEAEFGPAPPGGDLLDAWLGGWFIPPCALLWPRALVLELGGWDERLIINQDGDLVMRALARGIGIVRSLEGEAFYRRHPHGQSVSGQSSRAALASKRLVLDKLADQLTAAGTLSRHAGALGRAFHELARASFVDDEALGRDCARRAEALAGRDALSGPRAHRAFTRLLGLERKERLAAALSRLGVGRRSRRERQ